MADLVSHAGFSSDLGQKLEVELRILSYKALKQFYPYKHPCLNIEDIVAGFLQAADFERLAKAMPLLEAAVGRLPENSLELQEIKLFLARCQLLLVKTDEEFVQGLKDHFNPFPSVDRAFTNVIVLRANAAYFNPALSKKERLLAHQFVSGYVLNDEENNE